MEEPSTTGSGDSGVMNGTGIAGGEGEGGGEPIENYISQFCQLVDIVMANSLTCFH